MKKSLHGVILIIAVLTTTFHSQTTLASLITEVYAGEISYVYEVGGVTNPFGVELGDPVFVTLIYDDSLVNHSDESTIEYDYLDGQQLVLNIGSATYHEDGDLNYGAGYPRLTFFDGALTRIDYSHPWHDLGSGRGVFLYENLLLARDGVWDDQFERLVPDWEVRGAFDFTNPVPLPPAVLLFGFGLFGMIGIAARKLRHNP